MVVQLAVRGCTAEAWLNGLPVARGTPSAPRVVAAAHEAALVGTNRLELVVGPDAAASGAAALLKTAPEAMAAQLHLLLPRMGTAIDESQSRVLARIEWASAAGDTLEFPARQVQDVALPLRLPRWRWLDAPVVAQTPTLTQQVHAFVSGLARDLARGQTESFMAATRLRTEEVAIAYQRDPQTEVARLREWLEQLYASSRLVWQPLTLEDMHLRRVAGGRLVECLGPGGRAALATVPDKSGTTLAMPLRLSQVEGRFYVLR
jgi:hypothetical protein